MRIATHLVVLAPLLLIATAPADDHEAIMARIESQLQMPSGADALSAYDRYYMAIDDSQIRGVLVQPMPPHFLANPGRHWVPKNQAPMMFDGGCAQVNLVYDIKAARIVQVWCNGVA